MLVEVATNQVAWDKFLSIQPYRPFLQSWTMGEVYRAVGEEPIRLQAAENNKIIGICQATLVPARRGRHLACLYGPVVSDPTAYEPIVAELKKIALENNCSFIRLSPFLPLAKAADWKVSSKHSPLHLLAEHLRHLPLEGQTREGLRKNMRKTTRNLIGRAEREGVKIQRSKNPIQDLEQFITLHEETRQRHQFVPYTNDFFRAQVEHFSKRDECTLYLAKYSGETIAASVHMHMWGETSYHHGASTHKYNKIPASYLLQWTAICDALERGDHLYSFWGIAPEGAHKHPFKGVTTFKRGFGGQLLNLMPCQDIPLKPSYWLTRAFETGRKWKRGF